MSPLAVALIGVTVAFVAFWFTAGTTSSGTKWGVRIGSLILAYAMSALLSSDSARAAAAGQLLVYLGIPAVVIYLVGRAIVGRRR